MALNPNIQFRTTQELHYSQTTPACWDPKREFRTTQELHYSQTSMHRQHRSYRVSDYSRITLLSNVHTLDSYYVPVSDYSRITLLSNPLYDEDDGGLVSDYSRITLLSNLKSPKDLFEFPVPTGKQRLRATGFGIVPYGIILKLT